MRPLFLSVLLLLAVALGACSYESSGTTTTTTFVEEDVPPTTGPADLVVADQRIEGSAILIDSVTLPSDGFVVIQEDEAGLPGATIGISEALDDGTTANVQVPFILPLDDDQFVHVTLHVDMDRSGTFTHEPPDSFIDLPAVQANGTAASQRIEVVLLPPLVPGDVAVAPQRIEGGEIMVERILLPAAGFVALREDDDGVPGRILALSSLLPEGETTDLVLTPDPSLTESASLWVVAYVDRNEDGGLAVTGGAGADEVAITLGGQEAAVLFEVTVVLRGPAEVTAADQLSDGTVIEIESIDLPSAGWVEIRADDDGSPASGRLALSDLLEAGISGPLLLTLDEELVETTVIWIQLRIDFDGDGRLGPDDPVAETDDGEPARISIEVSLPDPDDEDDDNA
jgi:hypothetical protein